LPKFGGNYHEVAGKIYEYSQGPDVITAKLYNFEIGKFDIKTEHFNWLIAVVVPKLRNGGSISIVGLASRTGADAFNMKLSENRLHAVINLLRRQVPNGFQVGIEVAVGERAAWLAGVKDEVEQEGWRGVVVSVWDKPTPPPPPPPPPVRKPVDHTWDKRWLGFGLKSGGQLLVGGVESVTAFVLCLGDLETFDLKIISSRWGLGLGGGLGFVAVIAFGFSIPYELNGRSLNDWGINVAFEEKLISKSVLQSIEASKWFVDGFKNGVYKAPRLLKTTAFKYAADLAHVRNLLHSLYGGLEVSKRKGIIVLDLPILNTGLELSAFVTRGTMYVSNPSHWIEPI
jgi:hypothetical protein